jgi:hypothetical protein
LVIYNVTGQGIPKMILAVASFSSLVSIVIMDGSNRTFLNYICFLSSPFSSVIVFIVSHLSHFVPKSAIFQNASGVRKFSSCFLSPPSFSVILSFWDMVLSFYCYFLITEPVAQAYLFYLLSFWHR